MYLAFGKAFGVGNPLLYAADRLVRRDEACADGLATFGEQVYQDVVFLAVGDDDRDAFVRHLLRNAAFRQHTAAAERRLAGLHVFRQIFLAPVYLADDGCRRIGRIAVVYPIDVAQDDEGVHAHHGGDQPG